MTDKKNNSGIVKQIIGVVVDVYFADKLPEIYNALEIDLGGKKLVLEVEQHIGSNMVHRGYGFDRRSPTRSRGFGYRSADQHAGGQRNARPHLQRARRSD